MPTVQSRRRNFLWPKGDNSGGGGGSDFEQLKEEFAGDGIQTIFATAKDFQGVPTVSDGSDLVLDAFYNITGAGQITFIDPPEDGATITIEYLAKV